MVVGRDFVVPGEALVLVKGQGALNCVSSGGPISSGPNIGMAPAGLWQLGLAADSVTITPRFKHKDIKVASFGSEIPAEIQALLLDVGISMDLIHYDNTILDAVMCESLGGSVESPLNIPGSLELLALTGTTVPAGTLLGNGIPVLSSGCHFFHLNILSPQQGYPWRFLATYMDGNPLTIPLGVKASIVKCNFRAIPYAIPASVSGEGGTLSFGEGILFEPSFREGGMAFGEVSSSGVVIWDHTVDVPDLL
jgi:hypothetical protein